MFEKINNLFKNIFVLKIYTGNAKSHEYMEFVYEKRKNLLIESSIIFLITIILLFIFKFSIYMFLPIVFSIYNLVFIYTKILKSNKYQLINSSAYRIKQAAVKFFFRLDELNDTLIAKNLPQKEVDKWINYYVKKFKSSHSFVNFKQTTTQLEDYIRSLKNNLRDDDDKSIYKFQKAKYSKMLKEHFEELPSLISANKIDLKLTSNNNTIKRLNYSESVEKALRTLGLSSNTKNLEIVTKRYYSLVTMYHPDHSKAPDATKKLTEINKAYRVLKNFFQ